MLETAPARGVPREKELPPALRQGGEVSVMHILRADRKRHAVFPAHDDTPGGRVFKRVLQ